MSTCNYVQTLVPTPLGVLTLIADTTGLVEILWPRNPDTPEKPIRPGILACTGMNQHLSDTARALEQFFAGRPVDLPKLHPNGTEFQKAVWNALSEIPSGETRTYAQIAERIGRPKAVRAVASAIGKNPFCPLFGCHRVIGTDGSLRGFAGGLAAKKWLLDFEKS